MAGEPNADTFIASGFGGTVEYAVRNSGSMEAKEWLESQPAGVQSSFDHLFRYLAANGPLFPNKEQFKKVGGMEDVWEFKRGGRLGNRLFVFHHGRRWLVTHPYKKGHSKNHQTTAAKHAITIAAEQLAREVAAIKRQHRRDAK